MDLLGLKDSLEKFEQETIPKLDSIIDEDLRQFIVDLNDLLDRLSGTTITITIPPRKGQ